MACHCTTRQRENSCPQRDKDDKVSQANNLDKATQQAPGQSASAAQHPDPHCWTHSLVTNIHSTNSYSTLQILAANLQHTATL
jgi:hypothetical protein